MIQAMVQELIDKVSVTDPEHVMIVWIVEAYFDASA